MTKIYTKKPLGIQDQIVRLKSLGLVIKDEAYAEKVLSEVSYFRFAVYLRPFETDKNTHKFKNGSAFENAVSLYEFDNSLRQLPILTSISTNCILCFVLWFIYLTQ